MVDPTAQVSVRRQCELLRVSRSGLQYKPLPESAEDLEMMREIDELHLRFPFYGSRKVGFTLRLRGFQATRKRVQRLMRLMGIEALVPKPSTSEPAPEHTKYPYLLRKLKITKPNQVWAADITYVPMKNGFIYLVVIMDWYSRRVLAWRLSNTMDPRFCVDALQEALRKHKKPEIFNTDQGSQFTADSFTRPLLDEKIAISMDGKGRWMDNVFVERQWRSLKYEEIYLHAYEPGAEAREGIRRYLRFYNTVRPHQALGNQTPEAVHRGMGNRRSELAFEISAT